MGRHLIIYTDGGSRGNPGPGAAAYVLSDQANNVIAGKAFFSEETTNNVAEYMGLLRGLEAAKKAEADSIELFSDSELIVKQINGQYRVKSDNLRAAYNKCMDLLSGFDDWNISHIS